MSFADWPFLLLSANGNHGRILLVLFTVLVAAKLMAELFERIGQPSVVGEILAGVLIGPGMLGLIQPAGDAGLQSEAGVVLASLAEIGVVFLLFTVGLETRPRDIFKVGRTATIVAILGVAAPFLGGWLLVSFWPGFSWVEAIFLGAALVATSVGITARVLSGMGFLSSRASRVILAAAVIDDVIGLIVLAVVSSVARGRVNYTEIAVTALMAIGFTIVAIFYGSKAVLGLKRPLARLKINYALLAFALALCFGFAALAEEIGIAGIVGAFLAGVALSESTDNSDLHHQAQSLTEFTTPFFLVNIGMMLDPTVFLSIETLLFSIAVTVLAVLSKLIGCGLGASGLGRDRAVQVGCGMIPRGEVGIVVAQLGLRSAAIGPVIYSAVVAMAVATTLIAPPLIKAAFRNERRGDDSSMPG